MGHPPTSLSLRIRGIPTRRRSLSNRQPSQRRCVRFGDWTVPYRVGSLIAALTSRPLFTSPARVMVLFAVSASCRNIWSGPEDRHCKVHNGLTLITRPPARRAIACTLALGRCLLAYLTSFDELRCFDRRGPAEWPCRCSRPRPPRAVSRARGRVGQEITMLVHGAALR